MPPRKMVQATQPRSGAACLKKVAEIIQAGIAAIQLDRQFIGFEASPEYCAIAEKRVGLEMQQMKIPFEKD